MSDDVFVVVMLARGANTAPASNVSTPKAASDFVLSLCLSSLIRTIQFSQNFKSSGKRGVQHAQCRTWRYHMHREGWRHLFAQPDQASDIISCGTFILRCCKKAQK